MKPGIKMKLGIVDTMFSRVNMGAIAIDELKKEYPDVAPERRTVPGIKDLAVECRRLLDSGCDSCLALGMVGGAPIDTQCGHEASLGIQQAKLLTGKHILEVFVHENEGWSEKEFAEICDNRIRKHAHNAVLLVKNPAALVKLAGLGMRQGKEDEGPIPAARPARLALVVSEFNPELTARMEKAAVAAARKAGAECVVVRVPGAFDIPLVAKKMLMDKKNDAVVALGAVVKGETAHDEVVVENAARLLADLSIEFRKPVTLGIIGPGASWDVAEARAEEYAGRAVVSAISLVKVLRA
jgi:riboflavin synthase